MPEMVNLYVPLKAKIEEIKEQTADTKTYTIRMAEGDGFRFMPGQFNMVSILGYGEAPISISSDPGDREKFDHTIRAVGSITRYLESFRPGSEVGIRGPYGQPWPVEETRGRNVVVVAGGIGLAPLRPLIMQMFRERSSFGKIQILYGAREPSQMLFTDEFEDWQKNPGTELYLTADTISEGLEWSHNVGVVTTIFDKAGLSPKNTLVVTCGPEIMMRFVCRSLLGRGFYAPQIFLSMERRMKCGVGKCGHCQLGSSFVCKHGPVFRYDEALKLKDTLL
jgi:NAD(P)H-flavin reductase